MAKSIHNLNSLKEKISSKKVVSDADVAEKFALADKTLGVSESQQTAIRVTKKTFSIPENELNYIDEIKEKALNKRVILSESETIRLGLLIARETPDDSLARFAKRLEVLPKGRPKSK